MIEYHTFVVYQMGDEYSRCLFMGHVFADWCFSANCILFECDPFENARLEHVKCSMSRILAHVAHAEPRTEEPSYIFRIIFEYAYAPCIFAQRFVSRCLTLDRSSADAR